MSVIWSTCPERHLMSLEGHKRYKQTCIHSSTYITGSCTIYRVLSYIYQNMKQLGRTLQAVKKRLNVTCNMLCKLKPTSHVFVRFKISSLQVYVAKRHNFTSVQPRKDYHACVFQLYNELICVLPKRLILQVVNTLLVSKPAQKLHFTSESLQSRLHCIKRIQAHSRHNHI